MVCMPNVDDPNCQYYDIKGKRRNLIIYYPIKQLVKRVRCSCCGSQARGKTHHSSNSRLRNKIFNTFKPAVERAPRAKKQLIEVSRVNCDYLGEESVFAY